MQTIRGNLTITHKPYESDEIEIDGLSIGDVIERILSPVAEDEKDGYMRTQYGRVLIHFESVSA